jgi:hypothetical protein
MKVISEEKCQEWLKDKLASSFSWEAVKAAYSYCISYQLPSDTGKKTVLGRVLIGCMAKAELGLFWINGWGIFPSSENMLLFDGYRKSLGESRSIHEAPGHIFNQKDLQNIECLFDLALYFYWDSSLFDENIVLRTSHDEYFVVYSKNKEQILELSLNLGHLKLKQL